MITKAIIPAAGWGTRRLPITKAIEKSMLPIGNRPLIDYVVRDCIAAGITDIYFVVSQGSTQLQTFYGENSALNEYLRSNGKESLLPSVAPLQNVTFHYITQPPDGRYGTAIPVALVIPYLDADESVVVLMGDDFIYNRDGSSEVARLLAAVENGRSAMLGVNVPREEVTRYGVIELDADSKFVQIVEKPTPEKAPSTLINVSKYVLGSDVLHEIAVYADQDVQGEYYITEPINRFVGNGGSVRVVEAQGVYLDGGSVEGWLRANQVVLADIA